MKPEFKEIEFRKKINKINTLRSILRDKKAVFSKLVNVPEAVDECLKLKSEIDDLENQIRQLTDLL